MHNLSQLAESPNTQDYSHRSIKMQKQKRYGIVTKLVTFMIMKTEKCVLLSILDRMLFLA